MLTKSEHEIVPGAEFRTPFPFLKRHPNKYSPIVDDIMTSWAPGTEISRVSGGADYYFESFGCHGWGERIIKIVSLHKPGRYPERVFFTRMWKAPDGKEFGKSLLRITTVTTMRRWLRDGHPYPRNKDGGLDTLDEPTEEAA